MSALVSNIRTEHTHTQSRRISEGERLFIIRGDGHPYLRIQTLFITKIDPQAHHTIHHTSKLISQRGIQLFYLCSSTHRCTDLSQTHHLRRRHRKRTLRRNNQPSHCSTRQRRNHTREQRRKRHLRHITRSLRCNLGEHTDLRSQRTKVTKALHSLVT